MVAMRVWIITFLVTILILLSSSPIQAVSYIFDKGTNNTPQTSMSIPSPDKLKYLYGILTPGQDKIDFYTLSFGDYVSQETVQILVPVREAKKGFRPQIVFVDPLFKDFSGQLPYGFPPQLGGHVYDWSGLPENIIEDKKVGEKLMEGPGLTRDVSGQTYTLAVFDPGGRGGRYVLKIGAIEAQSSFMDEVNFILSYLRIKFNIY